MTRKVAELNSSSQDVLMRLSARQHCGIQLRCNPNQNPHATLCTLSVSAWNTATGQRRPALPLQNLWCSLLCYYITVYITVYRDIRNTRFFLNSRQLLSVLSVIHVGFFLSFLVNWWSENVLEIALQTLKELLFAWLENVSWTICLNGVERIRLRL